MLGLKLKRMFCQKALQQLSLSLLKRNQKQDYLLHLQQNALMDYKIFPALPHQDPNSSQYIYSEMDQYHQQVQVQAYNSVINQFKYDLQMQKEVWNSISNLDRPYKKGIKGIDTNLYENGPTQPKLKNIGFQRNDEQQSMFFNNEDRFIANTVFHSKFKLPHIKQWQLQKLNRPVVKDFNHQKGYKYDVAFKPQQKYAYLADRLGHAEFLGTPIDRLFKLQNDIFHPTYLDQPFVQKPSAYPSDTLNFQQGQVIYQNTRVLQWLKFWQLTNITVGGFFCIFLPYTLGFKTNLVLDCADQLPFIRYHLMSPYTIDILRVGIPIGAGVIGYSIYSILNITNLMTSQYIVKMSYSKDKELVFVKRIDLNGYLYEQVYEMAHLQIIPPSHKTGVADLSSQDEDGIWRVTCMNTDNDLLLYNDKAYWNHHLRDEFFSKTLNLWDKSYYGYNRPQQEEINRQWRQQADRGFVQEALPK